MAVSKKKIIEFLKNDSLFFDFSFYLKLKPTKKEVNSYKQIAKKFSRDFNSLRGASKAKYFDNKLAQNGLKKIIGRKFGVNKLIDVKDFTTTIDYRIPRKEKINHQVLKLVYRNKSLFIKEIKNNNFEEIYRRGCRKLGLPVTNFLVVPVNSEKAIFLIEDIKGGRLLTDAKSFNVNQLAAHAALADFLKKGGRDFSNYIVRDKNIYAIDNEFLFNKKNIWPEEMRKKYNELFALENVSDDLRSLLDKMIIFIREYNKAAKRLKNNRRLLEYNLGKFIDQSLFSRDLTKKDKVLLMGLLSINDYSRNINKLLKLINAASALLRKIIRQSNEITEEIFGFKPIPADSINFDHKTLVLKEALTHEIKGVKKVLEIGPGCNAILSMFLKSKFPRLNIECIDINADFVKNIRKAIALNNFKINVRVGDIVKGETKKYDLIFWNIPFVTSNVKNIKKITGDLFGSVEKYATETDEGGTNLIKRFLNETPKNLLKNGRIIFASNNFYVSHNKILKLIEASEFKIKKIYTQKNNTCRAYVLSKKQ